MLVVAARPRNNSTSGCLPSGALIRSTPVGLQSLKITISEEANKVLDSDRERIAKAVSQANENRNFED